VILRGAANETLRSGRTESRRAPNGGRPRAAGTSHHSSLPTERWPLTATVVDGASRHRLDTAGIFAVLFTTREGAGAHAESTCRAAAHIAECTGRRSRLVGACTGRCRAIALSRVRGAAEGENDRHHCQPLAHVGIVATRAGPSHAGPRRGVHCVSGSCTTCSVADGDGGCADSG